MSVKLECDGCGRVIYSAAASALLASGYRCPCGTQPRIVGPEEGAPEAPGPASDDD